MTGAGEAALSETGSRYTPGHLARLLGLPEPTLEQAAVIGAPLGPMAVIAGAGSGKSETMAARLVWLVANGMVRPDRVLGLTFTRKAAGELADRVRSRLDRLCRAGLAGARRFRWSEPAERRGWQGSRPSAPITPTRAAWSATTPSARGWSRRCA